MTTDTMPPATTGDLFADALMQAVTASAGRHHGLLDATRTLPHTAYTGQLNTTVTARVRATISVPDSTRARTSLYLGFLTEEQWDQAAAGLTARHEALGALMSGRVHPDLLDPAHTAGHALVPAAVGFECTSHPPTAGHPEGRLCEHAAVLAHALAGRFRTQPSALLAIRGCSLGRLAAKLRTALTYIRRPAAGIGAPLPSGVLPPTGTDSGSVRADDAYSLWQATADQPVSAAAAPAVSAPGYRLPEPPPGVSPGIAGMVAAAAQHAQDVLRGAAVEELDVLTDAVRHLATPAGAPLLGAVAARLGQHPAEVRSLVLAYRHGGPVGVRVTAEPLPADDETVERGMAAIITAQPTARGSLHASGNRITNDDAGVQLRLGPDGRWFPFAVGLTGGWQPVPGPSHDPVAAYRSGRTVRRSGPRRSQP
ncbi:hypothetical protein [Kitasatospora sp. GP82]|uniref:hypothetical protein n=1 Tax=Kitasatospora sp. GP82 TaxID=3035089 RepID=UPI002475D487|nr:hypothetical protein [Kitasatospora sp. GP82]MDH6130068.1 hypothetical protein [Kitasatospora sp. GP82]